MCLPYRDTELDRLRAEVTRLQAELAEARHPHDITVAYVNSLRKQVKELLQQLEGKRK